MFRDFSRSNLRNPALSAHATALTREGWAFAHPRGNRGLAFRHHRKALAEEDFSARLDLQSRAGALDLDPNLPIADARQSGGTAGVEFRGTMGDGAGSLRATTGVGDVELLQYKPPVPESEAAQDTEPASPDTARADSSSI